MYFPKNEIKIHQFLTVIFIICFRFNIVSTCFKSRTGNYRKILEISFFTKINNCDVGTCFSFMSLKSGNSANVVASW